MKYDFLKFNRKQIKKRNDEKKINIIYGDYKDLLFYKLSCNCLGIGFGWVMMIEISSIIAILGFILFILCLAGVLDSLNDLGCL